MALKKILDDNISSNSSPKLRVGNFVRISVKKGVFEKGFKNNFSGEIFKMNNSSLILIPYLINSNLFFIKSYNAMTIH